MKDNSSVRSAKTLMFIGYLGIIIGGIILITVSITTEHYESASFVGWACGFSTTIYAAAKRVITTLEKQLDAKHDASETGITQPVSAIQ